MTIQKRILRQRASKLRKEATFPERLLWSQLHKRELGVRFLRQRPLRDYIDDFIATSVHLVIEVDGMSHDEERFEYDSRRQRRIEKEGYTVLRFTNDEILKDLDAVVEQITIWLGVCRIFVVSSYYC